MTLAHMDDSMGARSVFPLMSISQCTTRGFLMRKRYVLLLGKQGDPLNPLLNADLHMKKN